MQSIDKRLLYVRWYRFGLFIALTLNYNLTDVLAQISISGRVYSNDSDPLMAAEILDLQSKSGVVTDTSGYFSMALHSPTTLRFSHIGYSSQTLAVQADQEVKIILKAGIDLNEIIVTALGIERHLESVPFAQQVIGGSKISQTSPSSLTQALSGRLGGMVFSQSSAGLGSSSRVVLRGNRSLVGNNQPLYVVDGIPISNFNSNPNSALGGFDYGDGISNLNPEDIESITVLKGPSGASLYGSRANNGVILIQTIKGSDRQGVEARYRSSLQLESAYQLRKLQNEFGQGNAGVYNGRSEQNWGPPLNGQLVPHWSQINSHKDQHYEFRAQPSNYTDFYRTGSNWTNTLQLKNRREKAQSYFSYSFTDSKGIVPTNTLKSHHVNYRTNIELHRRLHFDGKLNYLNRQIDDRQPTGENYANTQRQILRIPRNISLEQARQFEYLNPEGQNRQNYWNPGSTSGENPYWTLHRNKIDDERNRILGFASLSYDVTDNISLMVRSGIDRSFDHITHRFYNDTYVLAPKGNYVARSHDILEWNNDFLATMDQSSNPKWQYKVSVGGSLRTNEILIRHNSTGGLIKENLFSFDNAQNPVITENTVEQRLNSLYGVGWISYLHAIYLEASGRNDWSSTLPQDQWSFFYPSIGASILLHRLAKMPSWISHLKLRTSLAQVGNEIQPYLTSSGYFFQSGGFLGYLTQSGTKPFLELNPEITRSLEIGAKLGLFSNNLVLDFTYYKSNSTNQLLSVPLPLASGYSRQLVNAGNIQNRGFEVVLESKLTRKSKLHWSSAINFAVNKSEIISLTEDIKSFQLASDFMTAVRVEEGGQYGEIYSRGFIRNERDQIVVDENGLPRITPGQSVHLGNFNPGWTGGWQNSINYKSFSFECLIDFRKGGLVTSFTNANLYADGSVKQTLLGRTGQSEKVVRLDPMGRVRAKQIGDQGLIIEGVKDDGSVNDIVISSEAFWRKVGARNAAIGEAFTSSGTNVRLREMSLTYSFPKSFFKNIFIENLTVSVYGRNLFFIVNKADGFDPELVAGAGNATQGLESFALPASRSFGIYLDVEF